MKISNLKDRTDLGTIIAFAGHDLPEGYLMCDGSSYNITSQLALYLTIGLTYGGSLTGTPEDLEWMTTDTVTVLSKSDTAIQVRLHRERGLLGLPTDPAGFVASINGTEGTGLVYDDHDMNTGVVTINATSWSANSWYASFPSSGTHTATDLIQFRNTGGTIANTGFAGTFNVPDLNRQRIVAAGSSNTVSSNIGNRSASIGTNNHGITELTVGTSGNATITPSGSIAVQNNCNNSPSASANLQQITHTINMMRPHQHPFLLSGTQHRIRGRNNNSNRNENKVSVRRNNSNNQTDQKHNVGNAGSNNNNKHNHNITVSKSGNLSLGLTSGSWSGNVSGGITASETPVFMELKNRQYTVKYLIKSTSSTDAVLASDNGLIRQGLTIDLQEPPSGSQWTDRSGYIHHAIKEGNPTHNSGTPLYYSFDGVDDRFYIRNKHYDPGDVIREMSVFAWMRTSVNTGTLGTWSDQNWALLDFDRSEFFSFAINDAGEIQMNGGTSSVGNISGASANFDLLSSSTVNDGNWHYVGWTFSVANQEIVFYKDGSVDRTLTADGTMAPLGSQVAGATRYGIIGDGSEASTEGGDGNQVWFEGDISAVHLYDGESLTAAQVLHNFNATKTPFGL